MNLSTSWDGSITENPEHPSRASIREKGAGSSRCSGMRANVGEVVRSPFSLCYVSLWGWSSNTKDCMGGHFDFFALDLGNLIDHSWIQNWISNPYFILFKLVFPKRVLQIMCLVVPVNWFNSQDSPGYAEVTKSLPDLQWFYFSKGFFLTHVPWPTHSQELRGVLYSL